MEKKALGIKIFTFSWVSHESVNSTELETLENQKDNNDVFVSFQTLEDKNISYKTRHEGDNVCEFEINKISDGKYKIIIHYCDAEGFKIKRFFEIDLKDKRKMPKNYFKFVYDTSKIKNCIEIK